MPYQKEEEIKQKILFLKISQLADDAKRIASICIRKIIFLAMKIKFFTLENESRQCGIFLSQSFGYEMMLKAKNEKHFSHEL